MQPIEIKQSWHVRFLIWSRLWDIRNNATLCGLRLAYVKFVMLLVAAAVMFNMGGLIIYFFDASSAERDPVGQHAAVLSWLWFWNVFKFNLALWWYMVKAFAIIVAIALGSACVAIGLVQGLMWVGYKLKQQKNVSSEVKKDPGMISVMYRSWKDKYCTPVIIVKNKE